jgi:hypothetical protein
VAAVMRMDGRLRGVKREVRCTLEIWEEMSSTGRAYLRCRIANEPSDLPDGTYSLLFGGHRLVTRKWQGHWLLRYLPVGIKLLAAA